MTPPVSHKFRELLIGNITLAFRAPKGQTAAWYASRILQRGTVTLIANNNLKTSVRVSEVTFVPSRHIMLPAAAVQFSTRYALILIRDGDLLLLALIPDRPTITCSTSASPGLSASVC